jgi:hypothetical protein
MKAREQRTLQTVWRSIRGLRKVEMEVQGVMCDAQDTHSVSWTSARMQRDLAAGRGGGGYTGYTRTTWPLGHDHKHMPTRTRLHTRGCKHTFVRWDISEEGRVPIKSLNTARGMATPPTLTLDSGKAPSPPPDPLAAAGCAADDVAANIRYRRRGHMVGERGRRGVSVSPPR